MKIKCVKTNLESTLSKAEKFTGKKLDLPALSGILLTTKNSFLQISSTNIDASFDSELPVQIETEGQVLIDGDILYKTISNIKDRDISLELVGTVLRVSSKNSNIEINTLNKDDFPESLKVADQDPEHLTSKITISVKNFKDGIDSVFYAVSKSNIKPELASVYIKAEKNYVAFVATDGFRLAEKTFKTGRENDSEFSILTPASSASLFSKILDLEDTHDIEISLYQNIIFITHPEFTIFSRLTEGNYVDYKKLIPEDTSTSVIILKQDFLDAARLVNIFSDEFNQIKTSIRDKAFEIETKNKFGKNKTKIESVIVGDEIEMDFNHKYIQDVFSSIHTDSFEMIFNPAKPMLVRGVGDKTFRYIIMPLSR